MKYNLVLLMVLLLLNACLQEKKQQKSQIKYFDLESYMQSQTILLQKQNPFVLKSVQNGTEHDSVRVQMKNWKKELSVFAAASINKNAWIGLFKLDSSENSIIYTSTKDEIPIKQLRIDKKQNGEIYKIQIISQEKNPLYQSSDTLLYYPDSLYLIIKNQKTRFFDPNRYIIKGKIIN